MSEETSKGRQLASLVIWLIGHLSFTVAVNLMALGAYFVHVEVSRGGTFVAKIETESNSDAERLAKVIAAEANKRGG
jgi:hypothetical protein